ncbi:MAG: extracellular solute-binding protein [Acetobacteraceae bacterium]
MGRNTLGNGPNAPSAGRWADRRPSATRRRLIGAALPAVLGAPCIARARAAVRITVAGPGGLFQDQFETHLLGLLKRQNPGIEVHYLGLGNPGQVLAMLRTHRAFPQLDAVILDLPASRSAMADDLVEPLGREALPVFSELEPFAFIDGLASPAAMFDSLSVLYRPDRVKPPPAGWKSFWDRSATLALAIPAPPDPVGVAFTLIADRLFGSGDPQGPLTGGLTAIGQIAPRVASWDPRPSPYDAVIDAVADLSVGWNAAGQLMADRFAGRLAVALPAEGTLFNIHSVALAKAPRQPEAASAFLSFMLGAGAQKILAERMYYVPVNRRTQIAPAVAGRMAASPGQRAWMAAIDWAAVAGLRDRVAELWRRQILGLRRPR